MVTIFGRNSSYKMKVMGGNKERSRRNNNWRKRQQLRKSPKESDFTVVKWGH